MAADTSPISRTPTNISTTAPEIAAVPLQHTPSEPSQTTKSTADGDNDNDTIENRYIDFTTNVPSIPVLPPGVHADLPPCPDLGQYTNPFEWPRLQKQLMTYLSCSVNATAAYAAGSYAAPEEQLTQKWHVSHVVFTLGITMFTFGFGQCSCRQLQNRSTNESKQASHQWF